MDAVFPELTAAPSLPAAAAQPRAA
jgi:hypothetical protein